MNLINNFKKKFIFFNKVKTLILFLVPWTIFLILVFIFPFILLFIFVCFKKIFNKSLLIFFENNNPTILTYSVFQKILLSFFLSFISLIFGILISYPFSYLLYKLNNKFIILNVILLVCLPFTINSVLLINALKNIFENFDNYFSKIFKIKSNSILLESWFGIIIANIYMYIPFLILSIYNSLININPYYKEAANDLGANNFKTFWKITFVYSLSGVLKGSIIFFICSISSFLISDKIGNGKINLISVLIDNYFQKGYEWYSGAILSIILSTFLFLFIIFNKIIEKKVLKKVHEV